MLRTRGGRSTFGGLFGILLFMVLAVAIFQILGQTFNSSSLTGAGTNFLEVLFIMVIVIFLMRLLGGGGRGGV